MGGELCVECGVEIMNVCVEKIFYVIIGLMGVGKIELLLCWVEVNDVEIVLCDLLLFYCGMDIGMVKLMWEELVWV